MKEKNGSFLVYTTCDCSLENSWIDLVVINNEMIFLLLNNISINFYYPDADTEN